ncbi:MAG: hypothetical protein JXQ76_10215 [Campylobacterales bacterium]|nr:hypothetical protein [Campylobacterales bacterium]
MREDEKLLSQKLDYILDRYMSASDVARAFGFKSNSMITAMRQTSNPKVLSTLHKDGLEKYFNIPLKVWDKEVRVEEMDSIIQSYQENQKSIAPLLPFCNNQELLERLVGEWSAYFYSSQIDPTPHSIKHTIYPDGKVEDENGNRGQLFLGTNQSMIIKEATNSKNLVSYTFNNSQVAYATFVFTLSSKSDMVNDEILNFGFLSKKRFANDEVKKILGERDKLQMKIDKAFLERVAVL